MHRRGRFVRVAVVLVGAVVLAGCLGGPGTVTETETRAAPSTTDGTGQPTVTLVDRNGTDLATVTVRIANTTQQRYTGLSETDELGVDEGMLFVHDEAGTQTYVMRDMAFPLDIVFLAPNGTITTIHHAETQPGASGAELTRYPGDGKYVLELDRGYTNATGVDVGDEVVVPEDID